MTWIKAHLAVLVIVGALLDTAVFAVQGWQINTLSSQQAQISRNAQKAECWAHVLDRALHGPMPATPSFHRMLQLKAEVCAKIP